jgi:uncharacterized protein YndB with AHSA1/START domain
VFRLGLILVVSVLGRGAAEARAASPELASSEAASSETAPGGGLLPGQVLLRAEPEAVVQELFDEKFLVLGGAGEMVRAYVLFDRPVDRVFELLAATARQGEFRSELEQLATVAQLPDGHVDEHHIRILFVEVDYRLRYRMDRARKWIRWELDPSFENPMRRVEGSWELFAMDATHTLGRFATAVDVGEALPAFLEVAITRRTLPRTLERCRRWVNADGVEP